MKDFSLLYGPARGWLPVIAVAVLALVVFLNSGSGTPETSCTGTGCEAPTPGQLLVDDGADVVVPPAAEPEADAPQWERTGRTGSDVPFVSLQPSPDGLTDAGEDLVRSLDDGG